MKFMYTSKFYLNQSMLINGRGKVGIEKLKNLKAFIDFSKKNC